MTTTNQICPICRAAANQPCLFKVRDGYQNKDQVHIERARLDYAIEALFIRQQLSESDLDFVLRVNGILDYLALYLTQKQEVSNNAGMVPLAHSNKIV